MKFTIQEKKVSVSPDIREYAERKIAKLDRFFRVESDASVVFSTFRGRHNCEVTVQNNGMFYRVSESTGDMRASIDSAVAAIERQVRRHKTKLAKRLRDNAFERESAPDIVSEDSDDGEDAIVISRVKQFPIVPMSPEEAVLQMELLGHEFFMFRNADNDDRVSVVYRRRQGDFGMIEPLE
ncbi:MAG: ribosome-associated translation inhibitor RaiA [Oscillospiraceae bacterium]|jgi:putative sigma-54 modulation protein|nr:ribosome-associated translation inhibitor RaiA [Oscillospiraceae bacterium]